MFRKNSRDPSDTTSRPRTSTTETTAGTFSIFGADVTVTGNIFAKTDLHLDGRVEGDIACAGLVQGGSGMIIGAITAVNAQLGGHVQGRVCVETLHILRTAIIEGDVSYDKLTIEQGARVSGHFAQRTALHVASVTTEEVPHALLALAE